MIDDLVARLSDTAGRLVLFPVRHHSPACARALVALARQLRPSSILIEGPPELDGRIDELHLPHELPIAIYVHATFGEQRRGAYYPLCVYSPEWQALQVARELGAAVRFINLPWTAAADADDQVNRYADGPMRGGRYVDQLCDELGVDDFDAAWDELFEIEELAPAAYVRRAHQLCVACRLLDPVPESDRRREAFMAEQVRAALASTDGVVLVVTGGYHSAAILEALDAPAPPAAPVPPDPRGAALTPYSYERLDRLTGYSAGMPAPGFYHQVWEQRAASSRFDANELMHAVAAALRRRKQVLSTADLIGASTTARALAALRGHAAPWRRDLVDGLRSSVLKDEVALGGAHPLLDAIDEVLRGDRRGRIAPGAPRPPLVVELLARLDELGLDPTPSSRAVDIDMEAPEGSADRQRSQLLHRARLLGIAGITRIDGTDFATRDDLTRLWERWWLSWSPDFQATLVEATRYGAAVDEAVAAALGERMGAARRRAAAAAALLVDAALAAIPAAGPGLIALVEDAVAADSDLRSVAVALGHILYLHRFDRALATPILGDLAPLLRAAWHRARWLLESSGGAADVTGIAILVQAFEADDQLPRADLIDTLERVAGAGAPAIAGAAVGALWTLGAAEPDRALRDLERFRDPARLGDYLTGLFELAREAAQRRADLLAAIDQAFTGYDDGEFLEAAPALVLAFSRFTPREKHHIARTLFGGESLAAAPLAVDAASAARALELEGRVYDLLARYQLRGGAR